MTLLLAGRLSGLKTYLGPLLFVPLLGMPPEALAAPYYHVSGMVSAWAQFGPTEYRNTGPLSQFTLSDEAISLGRADDTGLTNSGQAGYRADLATGSLGAFALANNSKEFVQGVGWGYWNYSAASAAVSMGDDLYFTIGPGVYDGPLVVTFHGRVDGYLSASGWYGAGGNFWADLSGPHASGVQSPW